MCIKNTIKIILPSQKNSRNLTNAYSPIQTEIPNARKLSLLPFLLDTKTILLSSINVGSFTYIVLARKLPDIAG